MTAAFGTRVEFEKPLASLTSFNTGGPARFFLNVSSTEEISEAVQAARRLKVPYFLMGGGSNLLVSDDGFRGLVIKVAIRGLKLLKGARIECGAGEDLMAAVEFAADNALTGMEFAAGIWGSVGGAIGGNAGAFGGEIGDLISEVSLVTPEGKIKTEEADYCRFGYRDSALKTSGEIVAKARFQLQPGNQDEIRSRINEILDLRRQKHPDRLTAGCIFKNIPDDSQEHGKLAAGRLLDEAGAKGLSVGGAKVFERHANIIVNSGHATSADIWKLVTMLKGRVREKFGIELQEEIIRVGNF